MSFQLSDRFHYRFEEYDLLCLKGEGWFAPQNYGIAVSYPHTACMKGFQIVYTANDGTLKFVTLTVYPANRIEPDAVIELPPICGVEADPETWTYVDPVEPIRFTGGVLVGRNFVDRVTEHYPFRRAWGYGEVYELVFEEGILVEGRDVSSVISLLRREVLAEKLKPDTKSKLLEEYGKNILPRLHGDYWGYLDPERVKYI